MAKRKKRPARRCCDRCRRVLIEGRIVRATERKTGKRIRLCVECSLAEE